MSEKENTTTLEEEDNEKKFFVNSKKIDVFDIDTEETLLNRISLQLNTLPKYILIDDTNLIGESQSEKIRAILNLKGTYDIKVFDFIASIKKGIRDKESFTTWYVKNVDKITKRGLDIINDILKYFVVFSESELPEEYISSYLYSLSDELKKIKVLDGEINIYRVIKEFWDNKVSISNELINLVKTNNSRNLRTLNIISEYGNIKKGISSSEFVTEKIKYTLTLDIELPLIELFNIMELDEFTPFATTNNIYKFEKNSVVYETWSLITIDENAIILKMLQKKDNRDVIASDYTDIIIYSQNEKIVVSFLLNIDDMNVSQEYFSNRFFNTIRSIGDIKILKEEVAELNGVFLFPFQTLKKNIFLDLIMNDDIFASLLSVHENVKTSKKRKGIYISFLNREEKVSASMVPHIVDKKTIRTMFKYNKNFKLNDLYVKVKILKAKDYNVIERFKLIMSKLFVIYNNKESSIISFYSQYIRNFGKEDIVSGGDVIVGKKIGLREIAPDIYGSNYTRLCRYNPDIIDDEVADEERAKGKEVMIFPKSSEESTIRNYICNYPKHIFPGLMNNPFENKDKFPFVPCCYVKNQKNIKGSKYKTYYEGETSVSSGFKQQNLYTTNKIIPRGASGVLPDKINTMFTIIDNEINDDNYKYVRKGIIRSKSSFLCAVFEAMRVDNNAISKLETDEEINEYIQLKRIALATPENASLCNQEMYDYSQNEILDIIRNVDVYFDPKLFINMIQVNFKCNIFIFSKNGMILPRFTQTYIRTKNNYPCILIYEHIGSSSNRAEYPQNDLIFKWKVTDPNDQTYKFEKKSLTFQGIDRIFTELTKTYNFSEVNVLNVVDQQILLKLFPIISQKIDSYGKTRLIKTKFEEKEITLITTPLSPFFVKTEYDLQPIQRIDVNTMLDFVKSIGMTLMYNSVDNNLITEVSGYINQIQISIPIIGTRDVRVVDLETYENPFFSLKNESLLQTYNRKSRIARCISEYCLWLFSKYINDTNRPINDDEIDLFLQKHIHLNTSFQYTKNNKDLVRTFSLNSNLMYENKLICSSQKMIDKLKYILKLEATRHSGKLQKYYLRKFVQSIYLDVSDFIKRSNQVILLGQDALENYIKSTNKNVNSINDSIILNSDQPYLFKNLLISDKVFLAQNIDSIIKAIEIGVVWKTNGFNLANNAPGELVETPAFTLYSYENNTTITPFIIHGSHNQYNIQIIGYKDDDDNDIYTVLLEYRN